MALNITPPYFKKVLSVASTSTTATSAAFSIPLADRYTFYLNATTTTAGTMDTVFQTSVDGGTTYVNVPWRFAQVATTPGVLVLNVRVGLGNSYDVTAPTGTGVLVAATGGALALSAIIDPGHMKLTYTIGTGPYVFDLYCAAWPLGTQQE
jgi:hypothetical protein